MNEPKHIHPHPCHEFLSIKNSNGFTTRVILVDRKGEAAVELLVDFRVRIPKVAA